MKADLEKMAAYKKNAMADLAMSRQLCDSNSSAGQGLCHGDRRRQCWGSSDSSSSTRTLLQRWPTSTLCVTRWWCCVQQIPNCKKNGDNGGQVTLGLVELNSLESLGTYFQPSYDDSLRTQGLKTILCFMTLGTLVPKIVVGYQVPKICYLVTE